MSESDPIKTAASTAGSGAKTILKNSGPAGLILDKLWENKYTRGAIIVTIMFWLGLIIAQLVLPTAIMYGVVQASPLYRLARGIGNHFHGNDANTTCNAGETGTDDGKGPMAGIHPIAASVLRQLGISEGMITQGLGYGSSSTGTHGPIPGSDYGVAADINIRKMDTTTIQQTVHDLRMRGFVTWYREPGWERGNSGNAHIHAAYAGLAAPNKTGADQIQTFINSESLRRNGLSSRCCDPYNFPLDTFPTAEEIASVKSVFEGGQGCVGATASGL